MATSKSLKKELKEKREQGSVQTPNNILAGALNSDTVKSKLEKVLKQRSSQFIESLLDLVNSDTSLQSCEPTSVIAACMVAATLDLPLDKNLGYAWINNYKDRAAFRLGYKGYIQLALRTAQYKTINVIEIHEGELISWNPLTEVLEIDLKQKKSEAIIGYAGYLELINGFKKAVYWSKEAVEQQKSKSDKLELEWNKDFNGMAKKTVIRNMLSKWGMLSSEMQKAYSQEN